MNKRQLDSARAQLEEKRQELLSLYEQDLKAGQQSSDEGAEDLVDRANSAQQREFLLSLSGNEREHLIQVEEALQRVESGEYGFCGNCEEEISRPRLQAVPWARYCVDCQERSEQGLLD